MKKMSCVLLWGFLVLLQGAVVSTPAAVIRELEDRDGLLAFTLETPEHPVRVRITPEKFSIRAGERYWVELYDLPSYEITAWENGCLELNVPAVNYLQVMISPTAGSLLDGLNTRKWEYFRGTHHFPTRKNWTGNESLPEALRRMRRNTSQEFLIPGKNGILLDNRKTVGSSVTVISPSFSLKGGKEYMLRAEFAMHVYPVDSDASWYLELRTAEGAFYYNVENFYPRHTPKGEWLPSYLRFDIPAAVAEAKGRLIFHLEGAPAPVRWRNWDLRVCPAMRFKEPRKTPPTEQISDIELAKRLKQRAPATGEILDGQVYINGKLVPKLAYLGFSDSGHKYFSDSGVNWQYLYLHAAMTGKNDWRGEKIWIAPGKYDFAALDRRLSHAMKLAPESTWMLYLYCDPYPAFGEKHPDAVTVFPDGSKKLMEGSGSERTEEWQAWHYSAASSAYRAEVNDFLRALGRHLEQSPCGRAIAGVHLAGSHDGQYFPPHYDGSPANLRAFQAWLRKRYRNDVRVLSRAWKQEIRDFSMAEYPSPDEMKKHSGRFFLRAPADQRLMDASRFRSESMVETLAGMAEALKSGLSRPILVTGYYPDTSAGYDLGKDSLKEFLTCPALDGLVSVIEYAPNRFPGRGGNFTSLGGSLRLHKKLWLAELDYRTEYSETWNERGIAYDQVVSGASRNVAENDAQLRRDVGRMLTQGQGAWFFSLSGPGWSDPAYQKSIRESVHAAYMSAASPQSGDHGQMAVFHGEEDIHSWSGNGLFRLLTHQMSAFFLRDILNRSGLSYDSYLLSDLEHPERPDYPINIFVNCATLTSNQIRFIREKLQKKRHMLIFLFDTGRMAPEGFSKTIRAVSGIQAQIDEKHPVDYHLRPVNPALPLSEAFGHLFTWMRGPAFRISGGTAIPLAAYPDGTIAAGFRDHGSWQSIYIGAPGVLTAELLQAAAKQIGVIPLAAPGDAVYAGNGFLVIHATSDGTKKLRWGKPRRVLDLTSGAILENAAEEITVKMSGGETRWFHLTPVP